MLHYLVITHGRLADELLATMREIVGQFDGVQAVSLPPTETADAATARIRSAVEALGEADSLLILTDMFGGTPTNVALTFLERDRVEVLTGVNLPMLMRLSGIEPGETLTGAAHKLRAQGQKSIYVASDVLAGTKEG